MKSPDVLIIAIDKHTPTRQPVTRLMGANSIHKNITTMSTKPGHQPEKDCLTLFLLESYCGARACDTEGLSEKNIQDGMLSYVSQKTHVLATMPVHKKIPLLLSRKPKREYFNVKNRIIKRVAQKCGIDQPVTIFYHVALQTKSKVRVPWYSHGTPYIRIHIG